MKSFIFETKHCALTVTETGLATNLLMKGSGQELIPDGSAMPIFSATQDRPYNNEIKLAYMNKKTTFESSRIRLDGEGRLLVKFGLFPFEAIIKVDARDEYIAFTLVDFIANKMDYPDPMDFPPVTELAVLRLPFDEKHPFGIWMNVVHAKDDCAAVMSTSPHAYIDEQCIFGRRILSASARRGIRLRGCSAALVCAPKSAFLDSVASLEEDFGMAHGARARKSDLLNASVYWSGYVNPKNVDEHIKHAKAGGFRLMLLYYTCMCEYGSVENGGYEYCGNYGYNSEYPNGEADMRLVVDKIRAAGIIPGLHILHTHIGIYSKYVTPVADRRLLHVKKFTLTKPLTCDSDTIYVDENPLDCTINTPAHRILRFDGEVISYESYTTEPPYMFTGCKRGVYGTTVTEHAAHTVGGILNVTEFSATSIYLDQETDLQDEIAEKLSKIYNCGFEFLYFDGAEGTNAPFDYHIANAVCRLYSHFDREPIFAEGAAKVHFNWHSLSGGNAFDYFKPPVFKKMLLEHPFKEALIMKRDFTRVNFGWWYLAPETRVDTYEFGTSKAAAVDCPVTVVAEDEVYFGNARTADIFSMLARWEDARATHFLTEEHKEMLRDEGTEHTLLVDKEGKYVLLPYYPVPVADIEAPDAVIGMPRVIGEETPAKSSVRAFVFEHDGDACAVVWDDFGESTLTLSGIDVKAYTRELETEALPYTVSNKTTAFKVSSRAYIRTGETMAALAAALKSAEVKA